ncbi:uncharacterized protein [Littorina saxatilis]|uniref:Uncharacterized protein n=1 Tax=Littorina saxatilis TaxID=31220 RepID=A0AAN9C043_9CAEN
MHKIQVTQISAMTGRKKGGKCRERVQVHATLTFQQADQDHHHSHGRKESAGAGAEGEEAHKDRDKDRVTLKGTKVITSERVSFAEHAIKILDHMMKENSVSEVLKLGPREEMLGLTPLSMAAAIGHVEGTRKLLQAGAAVEDKSSDGSTALLNAAHWRHLPVLDLLLQHGASVEAVNNEGNNALMVALRHGDVRAVNSLWPHRKNLDINQANNDGYSALHLAADRKWESCVHFLIQNGADVNKQNNSGQTSLHIAASKGDHPTAERMLSAGGNLLVEDHCGNNAFCLAVRGFHDFLASYFLAKLRPDDKQYFCKRRVHQVQSQQSAESYSAWNAISFLTSDPTLRDALFDCDVIAAAVQVLGRRGLASEIAVQSCLVCCDLMYSPFPVPDERFVKQFLDSRGPEAVLDRLESRSGQDSHVQHNSNLESKELGHMQGHVQGQLQTRQQQLDFNTAFILLPVMAMAETPLGKKWFAESCNQQRLASHLRRLTSYRELLQLVSLVQQEVCSSPREVKLDRVAIVERFIIFFNTLENKDHEEKVRELLELEEREKSRKEKKREKKRQQRLKQKMKTRAGDPQEESTAKEGATGGEVTKTKSKPLDALDDIPLTVGPDGVQDVPDPALVSLLPGATSDPTGNEDEWVMVGGKRCYPAKIRYSLHLSSAEHARSSSDSDHQLQQQQEGGFTTRNEAVPLESAVSYLPGEILDAVALAGGAQSVSVCEWGSVDPGSYTGLSPSLDAGSRGSKASMRWADIARSGNTGTQVEDAVLLCLPKGMSPQAFSNEEKGKTTPTHKTKEAYHEQFPSLGQPQFAQFAGADDPTRPQSSQREPQAEKGNFDVLGAAHQFLEELYNNSSIADRASQAPVPSPAPPAAVANPRVDANVLYEALTGWMWQAAVAQGLVDPESDPPPFFPPPEFFNPLTSHLLKPKAAAAVSKQSQPHGLNENQAGVACSKSGSNLLAVSGRSENKHQTQAMRYESGIAGSQPVASPANVESTTIKDWFDMTSMDNEGLNGHSHQTSFNSPTTSAPAADKLPRAAGTGIGHKATNDLSMLSNPNSEVYVDSSFTPADMKMKPDGAKTTEVGEGQFSWPTSSDAYKNWIPAYQGSGTPDSVVPSHVWGQTHPVTKDVYGLPVTSTVDSPQTLEFLVPKRPQAPGSVKPSTSQKDFLDVKSAVSKLKQAEASEDRFKDVKPQFGAAASFSGLPREGLAAKEDEPWQHQEHTVKIRQKSVVVAVPKSSDSDITQSSPSEQRSEHMADDAFSLTTDTSRSSSVHNYESFHQLSPNASAASSFTGLHECLAPGFLRAAVGDVHVRSFGVWEDTREPDEPAACAMFRPAAARIGLLPTPGSTATTETAAGVGGGMEVQKNFDRQYPDLSIVPERDTSVAFPTTLSKASRVVGHGRPYRSEPDDSQYSDVSLSYPDFTRAAGDGSSAIPTTSSEQGQSSEERPDSPDVLFPETLRDGEDDSEEPPVPMDVFPSIHDMNERDLFQDVFSNSYFLEQIAIDQIRRRLRCMGGREEVVKTSSILFHDLDYYASLYGVRLRDILGPPPDTKPTKQDRAGPRRMVDHTVPTWKALVRELGRKMNSKEDLAEGPGELDLLTDSEDPAAADWPWSCKVTAPKIVSGGDSEGEEGWWQEGGGSRRWRTWLRQILDMPWTMRRQYGKIVMPARSMEFNISRTGRHPLVLGFLTDGTEVGVLALDRTRHALDTRLMATVAADSEPDVHFVLRYKAVWECAGRVYLAMELCDYTLDEYVGIVRLDHRQDPLSANRLAWQLLKGLKYLHSNFTVPHGSLMPGWIFVDSDGRLRLAGYGIRDVTVSAGSNQAGTDRGSIEGDGRYWRATEHTQSPSPESSFQSDIQVAGMLLHYILTGGRHPYGENGPEVEANIKRNVIRQHRVSQEVDHLVSIMTVTDPAARPSIDTCLKHPFFWSGEKRFRLVLIVGSDILTEMKTGMPLTGAGSTSMVDILNLVHITNVSDNWLSEVDPVLVKEMRAFRQYKNTLPELVLFVYNCCLHFDKMSTVAKEVLDDPCKYFQSRFPGLFMAVYRCMRASDRTDRTCYKPFF